jgi:hypothetical protein
VVGRGELLQWYSPEQMLVVTHARTELRVLFRVPECRCQELEVAAQVGDDVQVEAVAGGVYPAARDAAHYPQRLQPLPATDTWRRCLFVCGDIAACTVLATSPGGSVAMETGQE